MSGSTRSAEKMRLVAMSWGSGKEKGGSNWVLRHPLLHTLSCTPRGSPAVSHTLQTPSWRLPLSSGHEVGQPSVHGETQAACLFPPQPGTSPILHLLSQGMRTLTSGHPPRPYPSQGEGLITSSGELKLGPLFPIQPERFCRDITARSGRVGASRGQVPRGTFHTLISCASCCPVSRRLSPLAMARPSLQYPWQRLLAC